MKFWNQKAYSFLLLAFCTGDLYAETLLLQPDIQGYQSDQLVHAVMEDSRYFISMRDLAEALKFQFNKTDGEGIFLGNKFEFDKKNMTKADVLSLSGDDYYSTGFYEKLLPIKLNVDPLEMQLDVASDKTLPTTKMNQNALRRENIRHQPSIDSFKNYEFDNRLFSFPVMDFIYRRNENLFRDGMGGKTHNAGNYFQANLGMSVFGMDTQATLFGDDYGDNKLSELRGRFTMSRTLLDEPRNMFNLAQFQFGDVFGINNNLFSNGAPGRGFTASSFKDLVLSADKTINITGPLPNGWEAELYLNNQLIGFRQGSLDGRYNFTDIPVNYGLNNFKVILYGPFGEVREEDRRYYSGTSPVKAGELGYTMDAYQANRFLLEGNENPFNASDNISLDSIFYYGLSDYLTLSAGVTNTDSATDIGKSEQFGTVGMQLALNGVSIQYNTNYRIDDFKIGHHVDVQGNIYIGDFFSRYEYYGDLESPVSYYGGEYLRDLFESRLTGWIPGINVPYYVSYIRRGGRGGQAFQELNARLSPNFMRYYNFTLENTWMGDDISSQNRISALLQASTSNFRIHARAGYETSPDSYLHEADMFLEYRWDRNTFVQANWMHEFESVRMNTGNVDSVSVGLGRLFRFGGITISAGIDTRKNMSFGLAYNTSIGKIPDKYDAFINSETQMVDYGTIYARVHDEDNRPVPNVELIVTGREKPIKTDETGGALITNLEPYQKSMIVVDGQYVEDLSLVPEFTEKKLVLRPGMVRTIDVPFCRMGGIEGQIAKMQKNETYQIYIKEKNGDVVTVKAPDWDGAFLFDGIKYGDYILEVRNSKNQVVNKMELIIDDSFKSIKTSIDVG